MQLTASDLLHARHLALMINYLWYWYGTGI